MRAAKCLRSQYKHQAAHFRGDCELILRFITADRQTTFHSAVKSRDRIMGSVTLPTSHRVQAAAFGFRASVLVPLRPSSRTPAQRLSVQLREFIWFLPSTPFKLCGDFFLQMIKKTFSSLQRRSGKSSYNLYAASHTETQSRAAAAQRSDRDLHPFPTRATCSVNKLHFYCDSAE